jgi:uncharacterized protein (DUF488 family)
VKTLWTIGHSTRELDEFIELLCAEQIETLADVRRFPGSRRHPHFGSDILSAALADAGITYRHFPDLGGRRSKRDPSSPNTGWRVAAFAAYADYMLTGEFALAFNKLITIATESRTAIMCAEALPWQCHRRLIADQFTAQGWRVRDIISPTSIQEHSLPPFATVVDGQVTYPG